MTLQIIETMLIQTAVYWPLLSTESGGIARDDFGQPLYSDPIELAARWEDRVEEFITADGTTHQSMAVVYVESDVLLEGVLMLGEIVDIVDKNNPKENDGAYEIKRFDKLPTLDGEQFLRTAYL